MRPSIKPSYDFTPMSLAHRAMWSCPSWPWSWQSSCRHAVLLFLFQFWMLPLSSHVVSILPISYLLYTYRLAFRSSSSLHFAASPHRVFLLSLHILSHFLFFCFVLSCLFCFVLSCLVCLFVLSCLVLSCLVLSCLVLSCLALPCLVLSCLVLSCLVLSCLVLSCLVLSCLVLSCLVLSCLVLSCLVLSCLVLSCLVLSCLVLFVCLFVCLLFSFILYTFPLFLHFLPLLFLYSEVGLFLSCDPSYTWLVLSLIIRSARDTATHIVNAGNKRLWHYS